MAIAPFVNGECLVRTGTGSAGALESLGYTVDGVEIEFRGYTEDINADNAGARLPADVQEFGVEAYLYMQMVLYDETVLAKSRKRVGGASEGVLAAMGSLMTANMFRVVLLSPTAALPYNFPLCYLHDSYRAKIGTKRTAWNLVYRAIPAIGVGSATNAVLFNRTTS